MAAIFDALMGPMGGILAALTGAAAIWMRGRQTGRADEQQKHAADAAQAERDAHDRINAREADRPVDDDAVLNRLRSAERRLRDGD